MAGVTQSSPSGDDFHLLLSESDARWLMCVLNEGKPPLPVLTAHRIVTRLQWWLDRMPKNRRPVPYRVGERA